MLPQVLGALGPQVRKVTKVTGVLPCGQKRGLLIVFFFLKLDGAIIPVVSSYFFKSTGFMIKCIVFF